MKKYPMKRYFLLIPILILVFGCNTSAVKNEKDKKEFEGKVTYLVRLKSLQEDVPTSFYQQSFGDTMVLWHKNGKTRNSFNGRDVADIYYDPETNMEYTLRKGIDTLYANSCAKAIDDLKASHEGEGTERILNRECKKFTNQVGEIKYHYWFDPGLYVDPGHYKDREFGYLNVYYERCRAICLKYYHEGVRFDMTYEAIRVEEMELPDSIFSLPDLPQGQLK